MNSSKVQRLIDISKASGNEDIKKAAEDAEAFVNYAEKNLGHVETKVKSKIERLRSSGWWELSLVAVGLVSGLIIGLNS